MHTQVLNGTEMVITCVGYNNNITLKYRRAYGCYSRVATISFSEFQVQLLLLGVHLLVYLNEYGTLGGGGSQL